jgi:hypothetical protein
MFSHAYPCQARSHCAGSCNVYLRSSCPRGTCPCHTRSLRAQYVLSKYYTDMPTAAIMPKPVIRGLKGLSGEMQGGSKMGLNDAY